MHASEQGMSDPEGGMHASGQGMSVRERGMRAPVVRPCRSGLAYGQDGPRVYTSQGPWAGRAGLGNAQYIAHAGARRVGSFQWYTNILVWGPGLRRSGARGKDKDGKDGKNGNVYRKGRD